MATHACDTCRHLAIPKNSDHARNYRVCTAVTPLPANTHVWDRAAMEGRVEGSCRWIPTKVVNELKHMLKDCDLHSTLDGGTGLTEINK